MVFFLVPPAPPILSVVDDDVVDDDDAVDDDGVLLLVLRTKKRTRPNRSDNALTLSHFCPEIDAESSCRALSACIVASAISSMEYPLFKRLSEKQE